MYQIVLHHKKINIQTSCFCDFKDISLIYFEKLTLQKPRKINQNNVSETSIISERMTCVFAVGGAVPCLSSKVAQSMWMLGLCVRWISQARLKTARASSTLCDSRYWVYWIQDHKIYAFRCGCMNSKMSKLSCHTNKPLLLWSRTPHTERRLSGSAQRGCAPCGRLERLRLLLIPPEVGLWPLTPLWLPHLDLRGNNRKHKDFHIFYTHFKPLTERSANIYKAQHLVWFLWCPCSAEISPSPGRNARLAAGGGRVASHGSMDVWSADQTITCNILPRTEITFHKHKTWIPPFIVSCKAKHWELKFFLETAPNSTSILFFHLCLWLNPSKLQRTHSVFKVPSVADFSLVVLIHFVPAE